MKRKVCSRCELEKPAIEFYRCRDGKRGTVSACKSCHRAYAKRFYKVRDKDRWHEERARRLEVSLRDDIIRTALKGCRRTSRAKVGHGKPRPGWEIRLAAVKRQEEANAIRLKDFGAAEEQRRAQKVVLELQEQEELRGKLKRIEEVARQEALERERVAERKANMARRGLWR